MDNPVSVINDSITEMTGLTSPTIWGHFSSQPTLTELVRLGIANEEPDYIIDPVYSRYQDPSPWNDVATVGHTKMDQAHTQAQFLEQNDMTMIPLSEHSIPPESLAYLVEDDNSYLRLEQDLSSDSPVDVIGDDTLDTVAVSMFSKLSSVPQMFGNSQLYNGHSLHSISQHSNLNSQHAPCSKPLTSLQPHFSKPFPVLQTHISCSKPNTLPALQPHLPCSKQSTVVNLQQTLLSCSKTNSPNYLADQELVAGRTVFPHLQSHVTSRDSLLTSRDAVITSQGQRNAFPQLQSISDHRFSLQKLLGFGTPEHQQNLRVLAGGQRPVISRCINPNFSTQNNVSFQRIRQDIRPVLPEKTETKRKYVKRMSKDEQIQKGNNLWQFLMRLLGSHTDIAAWTGNDLEFRIVNKEEIARRWGIIKNREKMNFDKFSRALRYYYNKRILIHNPQCRLTYCFMRRPTDPVFCEMLQSAMRTLPNLHVCGALCNNSAHSHEMQYEKRKIRRKCVALPLV
ncbi:uncharacterized protein LOC134822109 [Bolinopsis microptera]|uniref:uncharacterized protein LOC134822109 n=1 Tax=Bolinopsis microptera TaxID=2820187 RepID=UPI00307A893B